MWPQHSASELQNELVPFGRQATHWSLPGSQTPEQHWPSLKHDDEVAPQQWPLAPQSCPAPQEPQLPPQPLLPRGPCAAQLGVQMHWFALHVALPGQEPQLPPQPSLPHCLPAQFGAQHAPDAQTSPDGQLPQVPPQPSPPQWTPLQLGAQHEPALQTLPELQVPQVPPQPSSPQSLPAQSGSHAH